MTIIKFFTTDHKTVNYNGFSQKSLPSPSSFPGSPKSLVQSVKLSLKSCMIVAESLYSSSSSPSSSAMALSKAALANLHAWSGEDKIS